MPPLQCAELCTTGQQPQALAARSLQPALHARAPPPRTRHKAAQLLDVRAVHALVPELLDGPAGSGGQAGARWGKVGTARSARHESARPLPASTAAGSGRAPQRSVEPLAHPHVERVACLPKHSIPRVQAVHLAGLACWKIKERGRRQGGRQGREGRDAERWGVGLQARWRPAQQRCRRSGAYPLPPSSVGRRSGQTPRPGGLHRSAVGARGGREGELPCHTRQHHTRQHHTPTLAPCPAQKGTCVHIGVTMSTLRSSSMSVSMPSDPAGAEAEVQEATRGAGAMAACAAPGAGRPLQARHGLGAPAAGASRPCSCRILLRTRCTAGAAGPGRVAMGAAGRGLVRGPETQCLCPPARPRTRRRRVALALDVRDGAPLLLQAVQRARNVEEAGAVAVDGELLEGAGQLQGEQVLVQRDPVQRQLPAGAGAGDARAGRRRRRRPRPQPHPDAPVPTGIAARAHTHAAASPALA